MRGRLFASRVQERDAALKRHCKQRALGAPAMRKLGDKLEADAFLYAFDLLENDGTDRPRM